MVVARGEEVMDRQCFQRNKTQPNGSARARDTGSREKEKRHKVRWKQMHMSSSFAAGVG